MRGGRDMTKVYFYCTIICLAKSYFKRIALARSENTGEVKQRVTKSEMGIILTAVKQRIWLALRRMFATNTNTQVVADIGPFLLLGFSPSTTTGGLVLW